MNITQINTAIIQGTFTNTQLSSIIDAVKFARVRLAEQNKRSMMLGDTVSFTSTKNGITYTGTVSKIAIKYVTVRTPQGSWRVPANMLSIVEDREFA
jgi:small-conductance mechanosensitive channel